jgi:hypothetical protein
MTYGIPDRLAEKRWQEACFHYLRLLFNGAPKDHIRVAAINVLKLAAIFGGGPRDTVH